jgi:hypothetical protein
VRCEELTIEHAFSFVLEQAPGALSNVPMSHTPKDGVLELEC